MKTKAAEQLTDEALVISAIGGEHEQFAILVERYQKAVFGLIYSYTGNLHDAQDLVQETFVAGYRHLGDLRRPDRFGSWIKQIAVNKAKNFLTKTPKESLVLPDASLQAEVAVDNYDHPISKEIMAALNSLSLANKEAVFLSSLVGINPNDGARILGISRQAYDTRVCRGLRALRKELLTGMRKELDEFGLTMEAYLAGLKEKVIAGIEKGDRKEKTSIARELRLLATRANIELLMKDLKDEDAAIRKAAACLCGETGDILASSPEGYNILLKCIGDSDMLVEARIEAIDSIERLGTERSLRDLESLKPDGEDKRLGNRLRLAVMRLSRASI